VALYHCAVENQTRLGGKSIVSKAAYRAGERLVAEHNGVVYDYSRKKDVIASEILLPVGVAAMSRQELWNKVEASENRKDSRLAVDLNLALPTELTHEQHRELVRDWVESHLVALGCAADVAYHEGHKQRRRDRAPEDQTVSRDELRQNNPHAHVLLTTRIVEADGSLSGKLKVFNHISFVETVRKSWANAQNAALERAGSEVRVDHRSLKAQGIEREPTRHLGPIAHQIEQRGGSSRLGDENRRIAERNAERAEIALAERDEMIREAERKKVAAREAERETAKRLRLELTAAASLPSVPVVAAAFLADELERDIAEMLPEYEAALIATQITPHDYAFDAQKTREQGFSTMLTEAKSETPAESEKRRKALFKGKAERDIQSAIAERTAAVQILIDRDRREFETTVRPKLDEQYAAEKRQVYGGKAFAETFERLRKRVERFVRQLRNLGKDTPIIDVPKAHTDVGDTDPMTRLKEKLDRIENANPLMKDRRTPSSERGGHIRGGGRS
jgi:hypothetical protein